LSKSKLDLAYRETLLT